MLITTIRRLYECTSSPSKFVDNGNNNPHFEKKISKGGHVGSVSGNIPAKCEFHSFNRFGAISI